MSVLDCVLNKFLKYLEELPSMEHLINYIHSRNIGHFHLQIYCLEIRSFTFEIFTARKRSWGAGERLHPGGGQTPPIGYYGIR